MPSAPLEMKSRLLSSIWLSLLLLFSQQAVFADTLKHVRNSAADSHQYTFDADDSSDDTTRQFFLDSFTALPPPIFSLPVSSGQVEAPIATGFVRLPSVIHRYYSSRAPPLL